MLDHSMAGGAVKDMVQSCVSIVAQRPTPNAEHGQLHAWVTLAYMWVNNTGF